MNIFTKESFITRQQNKIFLQLNLSNMEHKTHLHCHCCHIYYLADEYYRFARYCKKNEPVKDNFHAYSYGNNSGAVFSPIDNRCLFCKNLAQKIFQSYLLEYFHTMHYPTQQFNGHLETAEKNLFYDPVVKIYHTTDKDTTTTDTKQRNISFYFLLRYLNESLPKDIYSLIIDDKRFDDYASNYWRTFQYDNHKAIRIYILNELGNPVHNFVV